MVWMTGSSLSMQMFLHRSVGLELKEGVHCKDFAGRFQLPKCYICRYGSRLPCSTFDQNHDKSSICLYNMFSSEVFIIFLSKCTFCTASFFSIHIEAELGRTQESFGLSLKTKHNSHFAGQTCQRSFQQGCLGTAQLKRAHCKKIDKTFSPRCTLVHFTITSYFPAEKCSF